MIKSPVPKQQGDQHILNLADYGPLLILKNLLQSFEQYNKVINQNIMLSVEKNTTCVPLFFETTIGRHQEVAYFQRHLGGPWTAYFQQQVLALHPQQRQ